MFVNLTEVERHSQNLALELPAHVLEESRGQDRQAELRLMLSKRNSIGVTTPIVRRYDEQLDDDVRDRIGLPSDRCELVTVLTTVDCRPDPDCRFNWVRVEVTLGAEDPRPVACRLYPERAEDRVKRVRAVNVGASLSISVMGVDGPSVSAGQSTTIETDTLQYRVLTFGRYGAKPAWHFAKTDVATEVAGDIFLALIVAVPTGVAAPASLVVSAEAQLKTIPFAVPLVTRRTGDSLHRDEFSLRAQDG